MKFTLVTGEKVGDSIFLEDLGKQKGHRRGKFKCTCGVTFSAFIAEVRKGGNCGCKHKQGGRILHGLCVRGKQHPIFAAYKGMIRRCYRSNANNYHNYGGRGISICSLWLDNPHAFYDWCYKNGWKNGLEIDRIDNDGNYTPENCRWVTRKVNDNNRRNCKLLTHLGVTKTYSEWAEHFGLKRDQFRSRLKNGWALSDMEKPLRNHKNRK